MSLQALIEKHRPIQHGDGVKRVLTVYPAAIKSRNWREIARLANAGDLDQAKALAARGETHPHIRRQNVMARRLRIVRVELFARLSQAEKALRAILGEFTATVGVAVKSKAGTLSGLKPINAKLHDATVVLRRRMNVWVHALVKDSAKMGFRHAGDALLPIFKDNREAITEIVAGQALFEARLSFGLTTTLATKGNPHVNTTKGKWGAASRRVIKAVTKSSLQGLNPSDRIWELTTRTEMDLKRAIATQIANGESPYEIARSLEKYVSPSVTATDELGLGSGPGVYKSIYRNAMRLARTETNRAYAQASAQFAQGKDWVQGIQPTLSPAHDVEDDCDDLAAGPPLSPEDFADAIPAHPHCMCYGTYVIDPKYLGEDDNADEDDDTAIGGTD